MPDRHLLKPNAPSTAAAARGPPAGGAPSANSAAWLSIRNNVSRRMGQSALAPSAETSQPRERPSPRPDMFCP